LRDLKISFGALHAGVGAPLTYPTSQSCTSLPIISMLTAKQYSERKRKRKAEEDIFSQQPSNPSSLTRPHIAQVSSRSALGVATTSIYINNVAQPSPSNILNSEEVFKTKAEPQKSEVRKS